LPAPNTRSPTRDLPWLRASERNGIDWAEFPKVKKCSTESGRALPSAGPESVADAQTTPPGQYDPKAREILFGATQYQPIERLRRAASR